jgi:hypothetical protein
VNPAREGLRAASARRRTRVGGKRPGAADDLDEALDGLQLVDRGDRRPRIARNILVRKTSRQPGSRASASGASVAALRESRTPRRSRSTCGLLAPGDHLLGSYQRKLRNAHTRCCRQSSPAACGIATSRAYSPRRPPRRRGLTPREVLNRRDASLSPGDDEAMSGSGFSGPRIFQSPGAMATAPTQVRTSPFPAATGAAERGPRGNFSSQSRVHPCRGAIAR